LQYTSEKPADTITLNVYAGADASFDLYEDEGTNYNYEKGAFSIIPIKYNEATKTITVGDRKGSFNGMLQKRTFRINLISANNAKALDFNTKSDKEVSYEGKKQVIKL
jgi:alpha-D-xyloside xylohydrolase